MSTGANITAGWLDLVAGGLRDEGTRLRAELDEAMSPVMKMLPALTRFAAEVDAHEKRVSDQITAAIGHEDARSISDGLQALVGALTGVRDLWTILSAYSDALHPDNVLDRVDGHEDAR